MGGWVVGEGSPRAGGCRGAAASPPALSCGAQRLIDCGHAAWQTALSGMTESQGLQAPIRAAAGLSAAARAATERGCAHPGDPRILGGAQAADNDHTKPTTGADGGLAAPARSASCRASIGCPTVGKVWHEEGRKRGGLSHVLLRDGLSVLGSSSFVIRHSSLVIRRSSFVIRRSSFVVRRSSFVVRHWRPWIRWRWLRRAAGPGRPWRAARAHRAWCARCAAATGR